MSNVSPDPNVADPKVHENPKLMRWFWIGFSLSIVSTFIYGYDKSSLLVMRNWSFIYLLIIIILSIAYRMWKRIGFYKPIFKKKNLRISRAIDYSMITVVGHGLGFATIYFFGNAF